MTTVLVTGAGGFIGKHLVEALGRQQGVRICPIAHTSPAKVLTNALQEADVVYHLAGVNRPNDPAEYESGNAGLTETICSLLASLDRTPPVIFASSTQATHDNPYGRSKIKAEHTLTAWAADSGGKVAIFRLPNVFGKWCRPNYNSVVATFCYNVVHDLPIQVNDPDRMLSLLYIDDVVAALLSAGQMKSVPGGAVFGHLPEPEQVALGRLAHLIKSFKRSRETLELPSFASEFTRRLYATYLSYFDGEQFAYSLDQKTDNRGSLAEFIKQPHFGQVFVSRTHPGITRGNHYHHTKTEKFLVVEGEAIIRFRPVLGGDVIEHRASGTQFTVVDIPPGYAHSIENIGTTELVTLFWASEVFDPKRPDVYSRSVL